MKKLFKFIIVFLILVNIFNNITFADSINLYNHLAENDVEIEENDSIENTVSDSVEKETSYAKVSTVSSVAQANLSLNNVLCIILIAIGVLLILLAIAILIKLQK